MQVKVIVVTCVVIGSVSLLGACGSSESTNNINELEEHSSVDVGISNNSGKDKSSGSADRADSTGNPDENVSKEKVDVVNMENKSEESSRYDAIELTSYANGVTRLEFENKEVYENENVLDIGSNKIVKCLFESPTFNEINSAERIADEVHFLNFKYQKNYNYAEYKGDEGSVLRVVGLEGMREMSLYFDKTVESKKELQEMLDAYKESITRLCGWSMVNNTIDNIDIIKSYEDEEEYTWEYKYNYTSGDNLILRVKANTGEKGHYRFWVSVVSKEGNRGTVIVD